MQEKMLAKDPSAGQTDRLQFVPTPGQHRQISADLATMPKDQLVKELTALRESEKWTGLDFSSQKAAVKEQLRRRR